MTGPVALLRRVDPLAWVGSRCRLRDGHWRSVDGVTVSVVNRVVIAAWATPEPPAGEAGRPAPEPESGSGEVPDP